MEEEKTEKNGKRLRPLGIEVGALVALGSAVAAIAFSFGQITCSFLWLEKGAARMERDREAFVAQFDVARENLLADARTLVPVGTVAAFYGRVGEADGLNPVPPGWLLCDGTPFKDLKKDDDHDGKNDYAKLIDHLKGLGKRTLPDLRGQFLRGLDPEGKRDTAAARVLGSTQADALQRHVHRLGAFHGKPYGGGCAGPIATTIFPDNGKLLDDQYGGHPHAMDTGVEEGEETCNGLGFTARFDDETRPKNVAVNFIIKY